MTPERWQQMKAVFQDAWMLSPGERPAFLEKACGEDSELRADVESLLAQEANTSDQSLPRPIHELVSALAIEERTNDVAGRRIGPYRVVREIGKGGMGRVLEAVRDDDQFQQRVAIKVLLGEASGEDFTRRFRHERQILAGLDHPNIARLLDGGVTSEGQPYFVMEYVSGQAIDDYCRARRLGVTQQLGLFQQVCAAVEYAHQNLVVHRDLKPGNILVTDQGTVKLLDFGIAKLLDVTDAPAFHPATRTGFI